MTTQTLSPVAEATLSPVVETKAQKLLEIARAIAVQGIQTREQADGVVRLLEASKSLAASVEEAFEGAVKAAHDAHKQVLAVRNGHTDVLKEAEKLLRASLNRYVAAHKDEEDAVPQSVQARNSWEFRVVDLSLVPREYLVLDEKKVSKVVKAFKAETRIPGIEAFEEHTVALKKGGGAW